MSPSGSASWGTHLWQLQRLIDLLLLVLKVAGWAHVFVPQTLSPWMLVASVPLSSWAILACSVLRDWPPGLHQWASCLWLPGLHQWASCLLAWPMGGSKWRVRSEYFFSQLLPCQVTVGYLWVSSKGHPSCQLDFSRAVTLGSRSYPLSLVFPGLKFIINSCSC